VLRRTLFLAGVYESDVEQRISPLYERFGRSNVTVLCGPGVLRILLTAGGQEDMARLRLEEMTKAFADAVGADLVAVDREDLAEIIIERLVTKGATIATAGSCTGGLLSGALTEVPGASATYLGSVIAYSNQSKVRDLGVDPELIETHGAVSEPVARAMAEGVRRRFEVDWGIGVTGVAGPGGGTPEKPVGLVHWAVAGPGGSVARHRVFPGDRKYVRQCAVSMALDLLRRMLDGEVTA
jgi:nicotinamide-nucleotide amidase